MANTLNEKLLCAVKDRNYNLVKDYLIKQNCSLSYSDWAGNTCLHLASVNGDIEIVNLLLRYGSNVSLVTKLGKTALHYASQNGHLDLVKILVNNGCDVNSVDLLKMTSLHWSIENSHTDIAEYLCQLEPINLNLVDKFNRTCLCIANKNMNQKIIDLLNNKLSLNSEILTNELLDDISSGNYSFISQNENNFNDSSLFDQDSRKNTKKSNTVVIYDLNLNDEEDDIDDFSECLRNDSVKKKKLSTSPLDSIDETLYWIKNQSKSSSDLFENRELFLTEAGKLTLDYLNKNDPIRDEKRLFMKMIKDMQDEKDTDNETSSLDLDLDSSLIERSSSNNDLQFEPELDSNLDMDTSESLKYLESFFK